MVKFSLAAALLLSAASISLAAPKIPGGGGVSCGNCAVPQFHGKEFYLPVCAEDEDGNETTHNNLCGAICSKKYKQGSCDGCEKKCFPVFKPVCSADQTRLFANPCTAKCAGLKEKNVDFVPCKGFKSVVPRAFFFPVYYRYGAYPSGLWNQKYNLIPYAANQPLIYG